MIEIAETNRYVRQADLVPQDRLAALSATIIGVGAIGRQLALQLAAIGTPRLQLVDFDMVDATNVTTQGYRQADIGSAKVLATATAIRELDGHTQIDAVLDRYRPRLAPWRSRILLRRFDRGPGCHLALGRCSGCISGRTAGCWGK